MAQSLIYPNIIWIIKDAYTYSDKVSPTYCFLGAKWRLKFVHCLNVRGESVQLFLERISALKNLPSYQCQFNISTSIITNNATMYLTKRWLITSSATRWCVWDDLVSVIDQAGLKQPVITFICSILPHSYWQGLLDKKGEPENKSEYSPCIDILCQDFAKLFNNHAQSDVTLNCGDRKIYAHSAILSARSEVFAAMFRNDMKESRERSVDIIDMEPAVLALMIRYMYSGEIPNMASDLAPKVYTAADQYGVDALKMRCALCMMDKPDSNTPDKTVSPVASAQVDSSKDSLLSYFAHVKAVISTEEWQKLAQENPKLTQEAFKLFVSRGPS